MNRITFSSFNMVFEYTLVCSMLSLPSDRRICLAITIVVSLIVMAPNVFNDWVNWDDQAFVLDNPSVRELSFDLVKEVFTSFDQNGGYTPLVLLSWSLDYSLAENDSSIFHATNVLIHLINVGLVFWLIWLVSSKLEVAVLTAVLFGIHPTQVEPVAWITSRKDLLYVFFYLGGLISYLKYLKKDQKELRFVLLCFFFFVGSLFSKGMAVSFPLLLMVIDLLKDRLFQMKSVLEKLPFLAMSVVFGVMSVAGQKQVGAVDDIQNISFFKTFFVACYGLTVYVFKALIPIHLSAYHPYPFSPSEEMPWFIYAAVVSALLFVAVALVAIKKKPFVAFGLLFFLGGIAMVLQLFPVGVAIIAERFTYLANIGLFFVIALVGIHALERLNLQRNHLYRIAAIYLGLLGLVTMNRIGVWKNSETLWTDVIRKYPSDFLAYNNRAGHYASIGENDLAIQDFSVALEFHPKAVQVFKDRGFLYLRAGNFAEALFDFNQVVSLTPADADAYTNRGLALLNLKSYDDAIADFDMSIELDNENPLAFFNRGLTYGFMGNHVRAIADLEECLLIDSNQELAKHWMSKFRKEFRD